MAVLSSEVAETAMTPCCFRSIHQVAAPLIHPHQIASGEGIPFSHTIPCSLESIGDFATVSLALALETNPCQGNSEV